MFTHPVAAGEAGTVVGVVPWGTWDGGTDPGPDDAGTDGAGEVAAWTAPCEWLILGRMSQEPSAASTTTPRTKRAFCGRGLSSTFPPPLLAPPYRAQPERHG